MTPPGGRVTFGGETIPYEILYRTTRKTLTIEVHPDGRVLVRAPQNCPPDMISSKVQKRIAWISRQLSDFERYQPRTPARQYIPGESHLYLGRLYRLKVLRDHKSEVKIARGIVLVTLPTNPTPERIKAALDRWYLDRARKVFSEALETFLPNFKTSIPPRLVIRAMQTRWGSLSPSGTLTLNATLIRAPRPCIDYVVVHELCHLKYRDHNPRFFRLLSQVMPDWAQRKQRLEAALL